MVAVVLAGCGGVGAVPVEETTAVPEAEAETGAETEAALPDHCVAHTAAAGNGVLSAELVRAIVGETSSAVADVTCTCARAHGVYAPARIRLRVVAVPGRGALDQASAAYESGDHQPRDWRGFQSCVEREVRAAELPVHVIGSDVVPDPDPTDERVFLPVWIDLL